MFKHYFLSTWQNIVRQKLFAVINILGLAIGLTVFILIFLYVDREYSWDKQWDNADRIHWLTLDFHFNESTSFKGPAAPYPMMALVREQFPEAIEFAATVFNQGNFFHVGENRYRGSVLLTDREILDIFQFEVVSGSMTEALAVPGRIALTEEMAERYFGSENPVGKTISLEIEEQDTLTDYQVSAVFRLPETTSANFGSLSLLAETTRPELAERMASFTSGFRVVNYFMLSENADVAAMNARLQDLVNTLVPKEPYLVLGPGEQLSDYRDYKFERLSDAHFDDSLRTNNSGDRNKVTIFALIGILVLVMGSTNFVILATAKADDRKREVGVRKVLGASKSQLIVQYVGESVLYTFVAILVALGLTMYSLPYFSSLIGTNQTLELFNKANIFLALLLVPVVGILGGLYPAIVLAGFKPVSVLKAGVTQIAGYRVSLRAALACFQFSIATMLIIATLVLYFQLDLLRQMDLGFDADNVFVVQLVDEAVRDNQEPLTNALANIPGVQSLALSSSQPVVPGISFFSVGNYTHEQNGLEADFEGIWVDENFFDLYDFELLAGRFYDAARDLPPERQPAQEEDNTQRPVGKLIINRQMSESLGFSSPETAIGEVVFQDVNTQEGDTRRNLVEIIGVIENTKFHSLNNPPANEVYSFSENTFTIISLKFAESFRDAIRGDVEAVWKEIAGDNVFMGEYLEQSLIQAYAEEENEGKLLTTFSLLAIFIACLGLYGLAAYTLKKGVKEVGIRKVLGAKFGTILLLYGWRFSIPVLIANVIAWPIALWAMLRWLQQFTDQISYNILIPLCLMASVLSLLIAWVTVAMTTARAARANPVESLRYE